MQNEIVVAPRTASNAVTPRPRRGRRGQALLAVGLCVGALIILVLGGVVIGQDGLRTNLANRNVAPTLAHPFGTDWLGRDMLTRTLHGLQRSLVVGILAASVAAVLGTTIGVLAALGGGVVDTVITWIIDVFFSLPHLVLLILIAFAAGGGTTGVIVAVALTHWPGLARIVRADVLQLREAPYVQIAARLGSGRLIIARDHLLPHLVPQIIVGLILLFPHAILHEAGLTFIGIGLSPHLPAIGVILAESLRHIVTGHWWLVALPGASLLAAVILFDTLGEHTRTLLDPRGHDVNC